MNNPMKQEAEYSWEITEAAQEGQSENWDGQLLSAADATVFQSYAWGEYKRRHGWVPVRCMGRDKSGKIVVMAQVLMKKMPLGIHVGWSPGGPILQFKGWLPKVIGKALDELLETLKKKFGRLWLRFHSHIPNEPELAYVFSGRLHRPVFKINSEFSQFFDLTLSVEEFEKSMTSKHRYYVKQSLAHEISWKHGSDEALQADLAKLHDEMTREKGMESIKVGVEDIRNTFAAMPGQAMILNGYHEGEAVTSCLVLIFGKRGFYATAATGAKGREMSAAYAMVRQLFPVLKERGLTKLDFAGLDPKTPAAFGVNHFKRGFGGALVEYLGEWECASSEWLRWGINLGIWKRGGRL